MARVLMLLLLASPGAALRDAAVIRSLASPDGWRRTQIGSLPLLPFAWSDAMLPGETMQVHLFEPALVRLYERAVGDGGLLGQCLCDDDDDNDDDDDDDALVVVPVLQVAEACMHESQGYLLHLKCIGRLEAVAQCRRSSGYDIATGVPLCDADIRSVVPPQSLTNVCELHDSCVELRLKLNDLEYAGVPPVTKPVAGLRYEWGHESYKPIFEAPIARLMAQWLEALCERGMDQPPASNLDHLLAMWGLDPSGSPPLDDDAQQVQVVTRAVAGSAVYTMSPRAEVELHLLSFAVCSSLGTATRRRAMRCRSVRERLALAEEELSARRKLLSARIAIMTALEK